jgi:hypothetical protein
MKLKVTFFGAALFFLVGTPLWAQSRETLLKYVSESPDWKAAGDLKQYDESNVEALAGKDAAPLKHYGLTGVTVQDWSGSSGRVHVALFEMTDASAAYGFFTFQRNPTEAGFSTVPLGTEGFRAGNNTYFWQAKYVVRLDGEAKAAETLGNLISRNIFGRSRKPVVSEHLPLNNLVPESDKYIVDPAGLDRRLALDPNDLGFDDDVEIATGRYQINGKTAELVLFWYPTQQIAKKHVEAWDASSPDQKDFRKRVASLVAWVRETSDPEVARQVLNSVGYESNVTWDQPRPDLSLKEVILTIFTFIGIALLFTVVAGISFGGLRVFVKARYPDRVFDRSEDMEIIQLKLDQALTRKELHS